MTDDGDLAAWASSVSRRDIPASARHAARRLLLDQMGICLGGLRLWGVHPAETALGIAGEPSATSWSTGRGRLAPYAVLANRAAGDWLELLAGPECVPAAIAAAEISDAPVGELLETLVIATEVEADVRRTLGPGAERHGLHPPAVAGAAGAATAVGLLIGHDETRLRDAVSAALCLTPASPYVAFAEGVSGKTLYGAFSQLAGTWMALLASGGVGGPATVLTGRRGLRQALLDGEPGPPPFAPPSGLRRWAVEQIAFKPFPCSRAAHPALTALDDLGPLTAETIDSVEIATYAFAAALDARTRGDTPIAAQLSIRHAVALTILDGALDPAASFTGTRLSDPRVQALADRITVQPTTDYPDTPNRVRRARVIVRLHDGRTLEAERGSRWALESPAPDEALRARFDRLTGNLRRPDPWTAADDVKVRALIAEIGGG